MAATPHLQLHALADASRRRMVELLAQRPSSVGELATHFPISRPAVSQHLRILEDATLVMHSADGARNIYRVDPRGLEALRSYVDAMWERALLDFKKVAEATYKARRKANHGS